MRARCAHERARARGASAREGRECTQGEGAYARGASPRERSEPSPPPPPSPPFALQTYDNAKNWTMMFIDSNGNVWGWGENRHVSQRQRQVYPPLTTPPNSQGEAGGGALKVLEKPVMVSRGLNIEGVSLGANHAVAWTKVTVSVRRCSYALDTLASVSPTPPFPTSASAGRLCCRVVRALLVIFPGRAHLLHRRSRRLPPHARRHEAPRREEEEKGGLVV